MAKVNKWITARKALTRGLQYAAVAVAALNTVPIPEGVGVSEQATIAFAIGALGAVVKAVQNYRKVSKTPTQYTGYVLLVAGLAGLLAGCITTTAPDGTTTTQIDPVALDTAWATWERLEARRAAIEAAKAEADAQERARLEAELRRLEPEIEALARRLGLAPPE